MNKRQTLVRRTRSALEDEGAYGIRCVHVDSYDKYVECPKCGHGETIAINAKPGPCPKCGTVMK